VLFSLRNLLAILLCILCASPAFADTITYPNTFVAGTAAQAAQVNANFNAISTVVNGNIDTNNLKSGAGITPNQLNLTSEYAVLRGTGTRGLSAGITGDTTPRVSLNSDGKVWFGAGSVSAQDLSLTRKSASVLLLTDLAGTTNKSFEANQFDARTNGDANGKYTLSVSGLSAGVGGATAQDLLLKRSNSTTFAIRDAGDSADRDLTCRNLTASGSLTYGGALAPASLAVTNNATVGGTLGVTGTSTLAAVGATNGTFSGTLGVTGTSTLGVVNASSATLSSPLPIASGGTGAATVAANTVFTNNTGSTAAPAFATSIPTSVLNISGINDFRLTCSSGNPVPNSDVSSSGTIYLCPYKGNNIALYDGSTRWTILTSSQVSLALTATSGVVYDVFAYNNSGTLTLETLAWSNTTTRATALVYQDGVLVKNGATTRRYVGSFYAHGSNVTQDTAGNRAVYNAVNRTRRPLAGSIGTASWTYASTTIRAANSNTTNGQGRVSFLNGLDEDAVEATYSTQVQGTSVTVGNIYLGLDSTSASTSPSIAGVSTIGANSAVSVMARTCKLAGIGYHFLQALESSSAAGSETFYGNDNTQYGLIGSLTN